MVDTEAIPPPPTGFGATRPDWFRALIENFQELVVILDAEGRILWESPAAERVLGYAPRELAGRFALELLHPDDAPTARERLRETIASPGVVGSATYRVRHHDGSWRYMETVGQNLLHDPVIAGLVLNCRDITERVRTAEALDAARREAEAANRAKSEFLSRMSHELRTPLNAILGFGQILEMDVEREEDQEAVEQILRAGRHLLALIDEVLDLAKIEAGRMSLSIEPVCLAEVVDDSLELMRPLAEQADIRLAVMARALLGRHVLADRQRLRQVLLNLLSNAIKYNRPSGEVVLSCERGGDSHLRVRVDDTGTGIDPERLQQLFVPFERLGAEQTDIPGTGLGLTLCRWLVELMGGTIGVHSEPGLGSTFWFELPLAHEDPSTSRGQSGSDHHPGPGVLQAMRGVVLYIEDNRSNLRLMERLMARMAGIRLLSATLGYDGLLLARRHLPDLILLDLNLPDLPGEEVLTRLRADEALRATPVVLVTADATAGRADRWRHLGAQGFLAKPLDRDELFAVLAAQLSSPRTE